MLYLNGQDIGKLVLGFVAQKSTPEWLYGPEKIMTGPEGYLAALDAVLEQHKKSMPDFSAIILVQGPGSPTALRVSHALVNTLAFTNKLPILALSKLPDVSDEQVLEFLPGTHARPYVFPVYSAEPLITAPTRDLLKRGLPSKRDVGE